MDLTAGTVRPTHMDTHFSSSMHMYLHGRGFWMQAKNLHLLYTVWSDDYLMRFDAGVLWALSELARAPMHFNVLSHSHYFAVVSPSHSSAPHPPLACFFFSFLHWTSKDRRIMLINSTKTSWNTESEDTVVSKHACVWENCMWALWECVSMFHHLHV